MQIVRVSPAVRFIENWAVVNLLADPFQVVFITYQGFTPETVSARPVPLSEFSKSIIFLTNLQLDYNRR